MQVYKTPVESILIPQIRSFHKKCYGFVQILDFLYFIHYIGFAFIHRSFGAVNVARDASGVAKIQQR